MGILWGQNTGVRSQESEVRSQNEFLGIALRSEYTADRGQVSF